MRFLQSVLAFSLLAASCADEERNAPEEPAADSAARTQSLLDQGAPNWLAAGGAGLVEMVGGTDGEPDELSGRFALEGIPIADAQSGADRWVVVGEGRTQPLDGDGVRLAEARAALNGEAIAFIEPGPDGWLIGGASGWAQLLDSQGEPTQTMIQVLSNSRISTAAHNGNAWLLGADNGNVVVANDALPVPGVPAGNILDGGNPVTAIVADAAGARTNPPFLAFTSDTAIPVSGTGVPQVPVLVQAGITITAAEFNDPKVLIGTSDGQVGVADYGPNPAFTFTSVLSGAAVTKLVHNGTDWIALGANGQAQRLDDAGATMGAPAQISEAGRPLVGAHWTGTRWSIAVGDIGFVAFADDTLEPVGGPLEVLGGGRIRGASAGSDRVLVVGEGGAVQVLDTTGGSLSAAGTAAGGADLNAVAWNGDNWLVAGAAGAVQLVAPDGNVVGDPGSLLNSEDIQFVSWSGEFFLIGGTGGLVQVVRADGTQSGTPIMLNGATTLYDAQWSGLDWLVVGTNGTTGMYANVKSTDSGSVEASQADGTTVLRAVDFNGIEFLAAGDDGLIQRISAQGMRVDQPTDVMTGFDIHDLHFNGGNFIVAGEHGAVRRLGQDNVPLRTAIGVLGRETVAAILWTAARGFAGGRCLTNELCYEGPCVGGLATGRCCDSACDRPCESCFLNDTGQPDGTCAPVAAGKQPPMKEGGAGCLRQSESTCGLTGACDGGGECEFYGAEVECAEAICSLGQFTPIASCSQGACGVVTEEDCSPYSGCNIDGCVTTCNADQDCVAGFICTDSSCVAEDTMMTEPVDEQPADEGCCRTIPNPSGAGAWLLLVGVGLMLRRRPWSPSSDA